jgi:putative MFS transporter
MRTGDQIVQDLPWRWGVQGKIFIIGGLGFMFDAWDVALNGFLTPLIGVTFDLDPSTRGFIATANLIGMAIGAVIWGTIADRIGRKKVFSITILIFALFSAAGALSPNYEVFLLMRFLAGIGLGGCIPIDYAIVGEFCPKKIRGKVLTGLDLWWPIGATMAGLSSLALLNVENNWRWMLSLMVLPALLLVWVRRGVPESPVYLARAGREKEARLIIDDLVARTGATPEEYKIVPPPEKDGARGINAAWAQLKFIWTGFPAITAAAWLLFGSIMTVYYAALSWLPALLTDAGASPTVSFLGSTIMSALGIFGCIFAALVVERTGRKWLLGTSALVNSAMLVAIGATLSMPTMGLVVIGIFGFFAQVSIPVLYAYISELYPTEARASGFAWSSSISRVITAITPIIFSAWAFPVLGIVPTFAILFAFVVIAVAVMAKYAPETKGRELDGAADEAIAVSVPKE